MSEEYDPKPLSFHEIHLWGLQMHVMLNAGVPLHASLELIAMSDFPRLSSVCSLLAETIGQGRRLSEAMYMLNPTFSPFVINLVSVGEKSGRIVHVFDRIAERSFRRDKTERAVRGALAYPAFLGAVCLAMAFFMAFYMFPKLLPFLANLGVALPWPTRVLLWSTNHLASFLLVASVIGIWAAAFLATSKRPRVAAVRNWLLFKSPVIGKLNANRVHADSLNDLYLMLESNLDLLGCLKALNSPWPEHRARILDCITRIRAGESFSSAVEQSGMVPRWCNAPVRSADETGQLANTFRLLSEQIEESVAMEMERLVQLLEPAIMAGMGFVTGFIVVATFLPLYSMVSTGL